MSQTNDAKMEGTVEIPSPPGLPFLGNIKDINPELPLQSFLDMADKYGAYISGVSYASPQSCRQLTTRQALYGSFISPAEA